MLFIILLLGITVQEEVYTFELLGILVLELYTLLLGILVQEKVYFHLLGILVQEVHIQLLGILAQELYIHLLGILVQEVSYLALRSKSTRQILVFHFTDHR